MAHNGMQHQDIILESSIIEVDGLFNRDVRQDILDGVDLYLECEDDSLYQVPTTAIVKQTHEPVKVDTKFVIKFPCHPVPLQERFTCNECAKEFKKEAALKDHRYRTHGVQDQHLCGQCCYVGQLHHHLQKHILRKHTQIWQRKDEVNMNISQFLKEKPALSKPELVENSFNNDLHHIISEQNSESSASHTANQRTFSDSMNLKRKRRKSESKTSSAKKCCGSSKEFVCAVCKKSHKNHYSHQEHLLTHQPNRQFCCSNCSKRFVTKSLLNKHMKSHLLELSVQCTYDGCKAAFRTVSSRKEHMTRVHGEKQYRCTWKGCDRQYALKRDLKYHAHCHSKLYKCTWKRCKRSFRDNYNLNRHYQTHLKANQLKKQ